MRKYRFTPGVKATQGTGNAANSKEEGSRVTSRGLLWGVSLRKSRTKRNARPS